MYNRNWPELAMGTWQSSGYVDPFFIAKAARTDTSLNPGNAGLWCDIMNLQDEIRAEQLGG